MTKEWITIKGASEHNLKKVDLRIPRDRFVVITGVSGSGKSSLAFDTIFAEGQRRYVESLSAYARQFLMQMEKPDFESIDGLSPTIAIQQKRVSHNPRSTVGTITEIYDYLRVLFARAGDVHCPACGKKVTPQSLDQMVETVSSLSGKMTILAPVVMGRKGEYRKTLDDYLKKGFDTARIDGKIFDLSEEIELDRYRQHTIEVVVDVLNISENNVARLSEALETAIDMAEGTVVVVPVECPGNGEGKGEGVEELILSENFTCLSCHVSYSELTPRMFSFNSPYGACERCKGLGFAMEIDPREVVPDPSLSLFQGALRPMPKSTTSFSYRSLENLAEHYGFSLTLPFCELDPGHQKIILYGSGGQHINFMFEGMKDNRKYHWEFTRPYEGVIPRLERRMKETSSRRIREDIEQYMNKGKCPDCSGARLRPESLAVRLKGNNIAQITSLSVKDALALFGNMKFEASKSLVATPILKEIISRLSFLLNVGLDYITLDRTAGTLSSGEGQRIQLATQIGSKLCGVLYILDEPTIGLHQRDVSRLVSILLELRDNGNSVLVVEHDEETMVASDHIVDMGPGAGERGGEVVAQGSIDAIRKNMDSLTGAFLRKEQIIEIPRQLRKGNGKFFTVRGAQQHNLKNVDVTFPLGKFICVSGVSGSGKSTLVNDITHKALSKIFYRSRSQPGKHEGLEGLENIDKVVIIDQSPIGRTPRSNPCTYTKVFSPIRDIFARVPEAMERGYSKGRFSFNVKGGRCETCRGAGNNLIEMHFLPDVHVQCDVCKGKRFNRETLEVKFKGKNIADVLQMTVEKALIFFENIPTIRNKLQTLHDVGLGYMKLGQPATTLSGGEAQRVKLSRELCKKSTGSTFYILDEPTTGLHFVDVKKLIGVLMRLVDGGNTVVVIEHNLDILKCADHIIDLGPEGGERGGFIVAEGTPRELAVHPVSITGKYLKKVLFDGNGG